MRGQGSLYRKDGYWYLQWYVNGQRHQESSGVKDKREALRLLAKKLAEDESPVPVKRGTAPTVSTILDLVIADYILRDFRSLDMAKAKIEKHLRPAFGLVSLKNLTTALLRDYIDKRRAAGAANGTINRELAFLKRGFKLGKEQTPPLLTTSPKVQMLSENNVRQGFFEQGDYEAVLVRLPEELKPLFSLAYYTGCRRNELLGLRKNQVDLTHAVIRLTPDQAKNKTGRVLPLYGELHEIITRHVAAIPPTCPWLFHRGDKPIRSFRKTFAQVLRDVGLTDKLFHDLRRSAIRNMVRAGISETVAMAISGHKTRRVFERYNIVNEQDLQSAAERLSGYLAGKLKKDK